VPNRRIEFGLNLVEAPFCRGQSPRKVAKVLSQLMAEIHPELFDYIAENNALVAHIPYCLSVNMMNCPLTRPSIRSKNPSRCPILMQNVKAVIVNVLAKVISHHSFFFIQESVTRFQ
jgi:hypothetical protein